MADEPAPGETPERDEKKPTKTEPPRETPVDDLEGKSPDEIAAELKRTRESLKKANKEAADRRRRLDELEAAERQREEAKLTEDERTKRETERQREEARQVRTRAAELEAENKRLKIDHAVYIEAQEKGFEYPQDVSRLIDLDAIDMDEVGRVDTKTVKDAVERLAKARPALLRARYGGGTPPRDQPRRLSGEEMPAPLRRGTDLGIQELEATGRYGGRM